MIVVIVVCQDSLTTITVDDFAKPEAAGGEDSAPSVEAALTKLNAIVGMAGVKEHVVSLRAQLQLNKERKEAGLQCSGASPALTLT
jgi:hypothetical protein